jgi:hypothetical protein
MSQRRQGISHLGDITFSATDGSSTITVADASHGRVAGDFVTYSGAVSLGGNITADVLNQEYSINEISDSNSYTIIAREVASVSEITVDGQYTPTPVTANASDTGSGGSSVVGEYQVSVVWHRLGSGFLGQEHMGQCCFANSE